MVYTPQVWHNAPATDTPVSAERLGVMEQGIAAATVIPNNNLVIGGNMEEPALWANAFGVSSTDVAHAGTRSRKLTASGGGVNVDRLYLIHDQEGSPLWLPATAWSSLYMQCQLRRHASNTSHDSNLYLRLRYKDAAGTDTIDSGFTVAESVLSSSSWYASAWQWNGLSGTAAVWWTVTLEIDAAVDVGNQFYVDSPAVVDVSLLDGWQGLTMNMSNKLYVKPRITSGNAPATATATGAIGEVAWDTGFLYVCTATNTWKRVALAAW